MIAILGFFRAIPRWLYAALAFVALAGAGAAYMHSAGVDSGRAQVQAQWGADKLSRAAATTKAVANRLAENAADKLKQAAEAAKITKAHDEEMSTVRARLAATERMRRPAFCSGSGRPPAETGSAASSSGDAPDSTSGLLPEPVDRDIKALVLETEEVAATGRACQAFVRSLAP
jgi:hypothetical protein